MPASLQAERAAEVVEGSRQNMYTESRPPKPVQLSGQVSPSSASPSQSLSVPSQSSTSDWQDGMPPLPVAALPPPALSPPVVPPPTALLPPPVLAPPLATEPPVWVPPPLAVSLPPLGSGGSAGAPADAAAPP